MTYLLFLQQKAGMPTLDLPAFLLYYIILSQTLLKFGPTQNYNTQFLSKLKINKLRRIKSRTVISRVKSNLRSKYSSKPPNCVKKHFKILKKKRAPIQAKISTPKMIFCIRFSFSPINKSQKNRIAKYFLP